MDERKRKKMMKDFYEEVDHTSLLPEIKSVSLRYCEQSMTYKVNNAWKEYEDISEVLHGTVSNQLKRKISKDTLLKVDPVKKGDKIKELVITATRGSQKEQKIVKAEVDKTMNPALAKKFSKYLEGTLQLRNVDERMFPFLQEQLEQAEKRFCHVIDMREKKDSIDMDMTSQKEIGKIAKNMQKEFGGELKMDYKLHTRDKQTQKELHRLTATIIFPDVKKGDFIAKDGNTYEVTAIIDDKMKVENLDHGKKEFMGIEGEHKTLKKEKAIVVQTNPEVMAIDPENFQMTKVILRDPKNIKKIRIDQKLDVVRSNRKLYSIKK